jgi:hypothetical protein
MRLAISEWTIYSCLGSYTLCYRHGKHLRLDPGSISLLKGLCPVNCALRLGRKSSCAIVVVSIDQQLHMSRFGSDPVLRRHHRHNVSAWSYILSSAHIFSLGATRSSAQLLFCSKKLQRPSVRPNPHTKKSRTLTYVQVF